MSTTALLDQIVNDPRIPSPPWAALQVLKKTSQPDCNLAEISTLIGRDPSLCGKLLKMVNSAFFALPRAVTSIEIAAGLLGLNRIRSLVLSQSLTAMDRHNGTSPRLRAFWKASITAAVVAREMAIRLHRPESETELVAGLLCDIGMLVLGEVYPSDYASLLEGPSEDIVSNQHLLEREKWGVSHAEVSAHLLHRWHLPAELTEPIRFHHEPAEADKFGKAVVDRAWALHFASLVSQMFFLPCSGRHYVALSELAQTRYGMNEESLQGFLEPLNARIMQLAAAMSVDIGSSSASTIVGAATKQLNNLNKATMHARSQNEEKRKQTEARPQNEDPRKRQTEAWIPAENKSDKSEDSTRQAQKLEAIGRLAGGVAHDFNNLLTIINGYSEMLLQTAQPGDPSHKMLEQIQKAGECASRLTNQLLAFCRKQVLNPVSLDLNRVIEDLGQMIRRLIGEDIELAIICEPTTWQVKADPAQIEQVLMNLVVNARDAMPDGGVITIKTANVEIDEGYARACGDLQAGEYVMLTVSDTGTGMDEATLSHIFEPFYTTKGIGKGTGLGLATVYGIIKQSNGHIAVYSEKGHGTVFKTYLPKATPSVEELPAPSTASKSHTGTETVLVVEDEGGLRALMRQTLGAKGYTVLEAENGPRALELSSAFKGPIHLLLTDTIMPQMNGSELGQRLREARPEVKVLYTSGYTDDTIMRHGVLRDGKFFLQKPFTCKALASKVRGRS